MITYVLNILLYTQYMIHLCFGNFELNLSMHIFNKSNRVHIVLYVSIIPETAIKRKLSRQDPYVDDVRQEIERRHTEVKEKTFLDGVKEFITKKVKMLTRR